MNFQLFSDLPVLNSSAHSKMVILKDFSVKAHATLVSNLKADGYEERFNKSDAAINTGVYVKNGEVITLCRNSVTGEMRIMWEEEKYNSLAAMVKPENTGNGDCVLSQIGVGAYGMFDDDPMIGMLYLYKNSDGHAIILDGGVPTESNAADIYKALESHGIAKNEDGKYIIDVWIFSHAHGDHTGTYNVFAPIYSDIVTVNYFMYNFPGDDKVAPHDDNCAIVEKLIAEHFPEAKTIIPRMGQVYYFGNATVTALCSPDMLYAPDKIVSYFNDTSIVVTVEVEGVKTLFMGDGGDLVAKKINECFRPSMIKSDFVQITHHGLYTSGYLTPRSAEERAVMTRDEKAAWEAERHIHENLTKLYETAAPSVGLWPMGDTNGQPRNGRTTVMRDWSRKYGQIAYFVNTDAEDSGYDGVNVVRKGDLVTYTASSETELMITKFALKNGKADLVCNQTWESYLDENKQNK